MRTISDPITATTVDDEIVKLRDLEQITMMVATHQARDAFHVATHTATRTGGSVRIQDADEATGPRAEFMVLHDGRIHFQGDRLELLASADPYLKEFLYKTLPPW